MPEQSSARLLIVDDEVSLVESLCQSLKGQGYETTGYVSPHEALRSLLDIRFDLMLADLEMPEMDGLTLFKTALRIDPDLVGIIMTDQGSIDSAVQAMRLGATDYVLKPFKLSVILPVLSRAFSIRKLRLENATLQEGITARTAELEAANKELEAFTYSVSHDLRAPLRHISGFSQMLLEDYASQLPSEAQKLLNDINASSLNLGQLIEDLLRFSRLGRQPLYLQPVRMQNLVKDILHSMKKEQEERQIEVRIEDLPDCLGDPTMLRQVIINLLSNAFKFTRLQKSPVVEIGCRPVEEEYIYFVRDNGAGFDMQYVNKLFGVFQRLHSQQQFEGSGVGLSIVQRIIQRHGGSVWAESEVNQGATFYFSLARTAGEG
jgi:signal transduction histidine kinase